jgi:phage tail-like protein
MPNNKSARPPDPLLNCRFLVEIDGVIDAGFTEVSGLSVEIETEKYKEGGENESVHHLPTTVKKPAIVLKKGFIEGDNKMWDWFQEVLDKKIKPKNLAILIMKPDGSPACRMEVEKALPVRWEGSQLTGKSGEIFMETLTLEHQGFRLKKSSNQ